MTTIYPKIGFFKKYSLKIFKILSFYIIYLNISKAYSNFIFPSLSISETASLDINNINYVIKHLNVSIDEYHWKRRILFIYRDWKYTVSVTLVRVKIILHLPNTYFSRLRFHCRSLAVSLNAAALSLLLICSQRVSRAR